MTPAAAAQQPVAPLSLETPLAGPLFRRCDWMAALASFVIALVAYICMMSPSVTLEDSGELVTAAHTLGVPHPPGYPIWTILTCLFDHLNPLSPIPVPEGVVGVSRRAFNVGWRSCLGSATFGALAVGLLALLGSRSGSMFIRSVKGLSERLSERQERLIASVCGAAGGLVFAFSPVPLSQAVIAEVYSLNALFMALTLVTIFVWMLKQQDKYLYWTWFLWGLGLTNHQTLLFMAPAFFILVAMVSVPVMMDLLVAGCWVVAVEMWFMQWLVDSGAPFWQGSYFWQGTSAAVAPVLIFLVGEVLQQRFGWQTRVNWKRAAVVAGCILAGLAFYAYMPLASLTNPPMNWGYTRDKDGFWHHFSRGQYEKMKIYRPLPMFFDQLLFFGKDLRDQYTSLMVLIGLGSLMWVFDGNRRSKKWMLFMVAAFFFTSFTFIVLANPTLDRAVRFNDRVFFILTHAVFCAWIGYGLMWGLSYLVGHLEKLRWLLFGALAGLCLLQVGYQLLYHAQSATAEESEWVWVGVQLAFLAGLAVLLFFSEKDRMPLRPTLALVGLLPLAGLARNWADNEQHGHLFGWYFGYHMFVPGGGYPDMDKDAILYGGTDPGRFVPTYMIFCPRVRPDVYIITQNALAENTYLRYLRAQYSPSRKKDGFNWFEQVLQRDTTYPREDIYISTDEDSAAAIRSYVEELQRRPALPGEQVTVVNGRVNIQGVQAVTALNGLVSKQIFDREHNKRSFYVEESFVIQWMYNYLEPYGVIMKINREPLPKITPEMVALNRKYWDAYVQKYLVNDPKFRRDDDAQRAFSKLRTAHAGLYAWRATLAPPEQRQPELAPEAEYAFKQCLELCPFNVEATFRYAEFLTRLERYADAHKVVNDYTKHDPQNPQIPIVLNQIQQLSQLAGQEIGLRQKLAATPNDLNTIMQFLSVLATRGKFPEMDGIIDQLIEHKEMPAQHFKTIAQTYVQLTRFDRVEKVLRKYLGFYPDDAQAWYDLTVVLVQAQQADPALDWLEKAIRINPAFKQGAQQDNRIERVKLFPRFQQLVR
ncbi:MAG: DUF2723 domain-containing protein [Verrucomicrobia bacterium]|nr:DUF2723 domain-containing protein [Verrucomicrobiota bacterium]